MYIIYKQNIDIETEEVVKILNTNDEHKVVLWINDYVSKELESWSLAPSLPNTKYVSYMMKQNGKTVNVVRRYKLIHKGYVYNSSEWREDILTTLKYIGCDSEAINDLTINETTKSELWHDINTDINNRVLQQMDAESLYNVFGHFTRSIKEKPKWMQEDLTMIISECLRKTNRDLYVAMVRKVKRLSKRNGMIFIEPKKKME